uniref:DNA mismatch repair protein S5 domain-containing protein n=1 Tax=Glossina austeni TaxID=7395 RepID=A0A1A9VQJ7_GLOAU
MADDIIIPEPTKAESTAIKSIKEEDVHKICSGQVILTLAVAVKELVENAIDAGAKNVEVKLRDKGLESVEVCDDGCGVKPNDLESMTAKYHTSKIQKFQDLQSVETFGFRGEALSSLCALTEMSIITRHRDCNEAIKIVLDRKGKIISRNCHTRAPGTTVLLTNLFATLPVRRKDFERNIKKEFAKMCQILQAYCLVSTGIRIRCTNQAPNGASSLIMMTQGCEDVLSNIYAIFGRPKLGEIIKLESPLKDNKGDVLTQDELISALQANAGDNANITKEDISSLYNREFELGGYISSCAHGSGRSSKDRQFFYVNSRPCDLKNISKAVNDCYHSFNNSQYPFIYLNIITSRQEVDVNLTPDKRQLMLNNEKLLLSLIRRSLHLTFDQIPATYKLQNTTISDMQPQENNIDLETIPQTLELTAVNEMTLMENLPVFEKNGFKFSINSNAPPTKKVSLLGKPFSKNWEFGKEDIDELIFMLQDAPEGTVCRPSRISAMFASRACRKSIMIGTALKKSTMRQLIQHMGEMEQPWNCPHGRPTMRHLINTAMLLDDTEINENK